MAFEYQTPGTRLWWGNVRQWCGCAVTIERRRLSGARHAALRAHAAALPRELIEREKEIAAIDDALWLLKHGPVSLRRPQRGYREGHPTTTAIIHLSNRRALLLREKDEIPAGDNWLTMQQ